MEGNRDMRRLRRGSVMLTTALFTLFLVLFAGLMATWFQLWTIRMQVEGAVDRALYAAAMQVDRVAYAYGDIVILPDEAGHEFEAMLLRELSLQSNGIPTREWSVKNVKIEDFNVYYPSDVTPEGVMIDRPSVHARVTATVVPIIFRALKPEVEITVATVVGANCPPGAYCDKSS